MKYRKKSSEFEAMRWTGENTSEVIDWILGTGAHCVRWREETDEVTWRAEMASGASWRPRFEHLAIDRGAGGLYHVTVGNWVTLEPDGTHYWCGAETFDAVYEAVTA